MAPQKERRLWRATLVAALAVTAAVAAGAALAGGGHHGAYAVTRLVSDQPGVATTQDGSLVNAWGLVAGPGTPGTPWWVSDNGTNSSTLYRADGSKVALTVAVAGGPTGVVFNGTAGFVLGAGPARFIFASEDGKIRGWNGGAAATVVASGAAGASYKGLAILGSRLYAANFAAGTVDVFNSTFGPATVSGGFADPRLPDDFAPFGIQAVGDRIVVAFAKKEAGGDEEEAGRGLGVVDAFDADGNLVARVAQRGRLNAPWGIALAPSNFGRFSGDLLIGNFGDGRINAYEENEPGHFEPRGTLRGVDGKPIEIDGLWALEFGMGNANSGPTNTLFFTAGPEEETHGLFGTITAVAAPSHNDDDEDQAEVDDD